MILTSVSGRNPGSTDTTQGRSIRRVSGPAESAPALPYSQGFVPCPFALTTFLVSLHSGVKTLHTTGVERGRHRDCDTVTATPAFCTCTGRPRTPRRPLRGGPGLPEDTGSSFPELPGPQRGGARRTGPRSSGPGISAPGTAAPPSRGSPVTAGHWTLETGPARGWVSSGTALESP